ncbi:MAG: toprim domain-containing protein [Amylibacter sp.]
MRDLKYFRFTNDHLNEIRATLNWETFFAGLGLIKDDAKSKADDWWALSPFKQEKTPSFHMKPLGIWYDFASGEGGGPIELVQKIEGVDCYEAARIILRNGWAYLSDGNFGDQNAGQGVAVKKLVQPYEQPKAKPLENAPITTDLRNILKYHPLLEERGISKATCKALGIGYLPKGKSQLSDRIVFQVADVHEGSAGKSRVVISHLGCAIGDSDRKYLFYAGFHKSVELYGQEIIALNPKAQEQIKATGRIVITEGTFDVAKAYEAGLRNVVGTFGSTLSEAQAKKLVKLAREYGATEICIAYDRDAAGVTGAEKAAALIHTLGLDVCIFDWKASIAERCKGSVFIPERIKDIGDLSVLQIRWLRRQGMI